MSLDLPESSEEIEQRTQTDVEREVNKNNDGNQANPFLQVNWILGLIVGFTRRIFDFYGQLRILTREVFWHTMRLTESITGWASVFGQTQNAASQSSGNVVAIGTLGSTITTAAKYQDSAGNTYDVQANATITAKAVTIQELTRVGSIATATLSSDQSLSPDVPVDISGADQSEFNVAGAVITPISANQFTYQVEGTPVTPATGSILANFETAVVSLKSEEFGTEVNQTAFAPLTLTAPIAGVNDEGKVDFNELGGGSDQETVDELYGRFIEARQNPIAHFNESDITQQAKTVTGVTRVFVQEAGTIVGSISISSMERLQDQGAADTGVVQVETSADHGFEDGFRTTITGAGELEFNVTEAVLIVTDTDKFAIFAPGSTDFASGTPEASTFIPPGILRVLFIRGNDDDMIPSGSEVTAVDAALDEIRPANTDDQDMLVEGPIPSDTDFTFTELTPNNTTMQSAIEANLDAYSRDEAVPGVAVTEEEYISIIQETIDPITGQRVATFELAAPIGDITVNPQTIFRPGNFAFP